MRRSPPQFARLCVQGSVPMLDGERFDVDGHHFQLLHCEPGVSILVHLDERGLLSPSPDCFTVHAGVRELPRNEPTACAFGWELDAGRNYCMRYLGAPRPVLQLNSL